MFRSAALILVLNKKGRANTRPFFFFAAPPRLDTILKNCAVFSRSGGAAAPLLSHLK
jgi:hypothetical protein